MSKLYKNAVKQQEDKTLQLDKVVENFMGGDSYTVNPLDTLKMVTASSIFGEPSYYRGSKMGGASYVSRIWDKELKGYLGEHLMKFAEPKETTEDIMIKAIDDALAYDFEATLKWAAELRHEYFIRLNPQVILARAAMHPKRQEFTEKAAPGTFRKYASQIMSRADDAMSGIAYYMYATGGKGKMPSVLKRSYADKLSKLNAYQVAKYKNHEMGLIDATRIVHANSKVLDELMKNGTVEVSESDKTWENLRSEGKSWEEIFQTVSMGHMALLRNIRGFFNEVTDMELRKQYLEKLKAGVLTGKQFPFRYYNAYNVIEKETFRGKEMVLDALEECLDISLDNMPKLEGNTVILTDNSGSAWGAVPTEYGKVTIAEINNLSAVITAARSDYGVVIKFGDTTRTWEISKRKGILAQAKAISKDQYSDVGGNTEGGIWEFFHNAITAKEKWDNIFIYSDQQAGHGGLYGTYTHKKAYEQEYGCCGSNINVFKLVLEYRKKVNKKANVFSVQTAGYDNNIIPDYAYRTNLMYGWTGREIIFAKAMIDLWNQVENR